MKPIVSSVFTRALVLAVALACAAQALAQSDPLPSWNDGPAKKAIVEFVQTTTAQGSAKFVPTAGARIRSIPMSNATTTGKRGS